MSYAYPLDSVVTYDALGTPQYDRAVTSETLRTILHVMLTDGVFLEENIDMQVTATGSMSVQVGKGYCVIRGAQKIFGTPEIVQIPASNTLNRIDTIVARLDLNQDVRDVVLDVVSGTPSSTPVAPELTRTSSIWEIGLANVKVTANSSVIAQENITDTRLDTNRCGLVSSLMSFDTTSLYDQIQADLLTFKDINETDFEYWSTARKDEWLNWIATNEADFLAWYQRMKDHLSEDQAGHLQLQIDALNVDLSERIDDLEAEMPFAGGSKVNINFEYDVIPNIQYSNEHYKLTVGDTVRENDFSSSELHFDEYGILTVGDGILEVTYDVTYLRTGKITPVSYTYTVEMPYFGRFAFSVTLSATMYNYDEWLSSGRVTKTFSSLEEILADQTTLRQLMTIHASADYMIEWLQNDEAFRSALLASDNALKWIGLRDYTYDKLPSDFISEWLSGQYWERALKDHVPAMTSNNTPYGVASANQSYETMDPYKPFAKPNGSWMPIGVNLKPNWISYKFTNPISIKRAIAKWGRESGSLTNLNTRIQGSNDGSNWVNLSNTVVILASIYEDKEYTYNIESNDYYLYYRLYIDDAIVQGAGRQWYLRQLQFYGRSLNVSVPVMTSNTAPYGEITTPDGIYNTGYETYRAFDKNNDTQWNAADTSVLKEQTLAYRFPRKVHAKKIYLNAGGSSLGDRLYHIDYLTNDNVWEEIANVNSIRNIGYNGYIDCNIDSSDFRIRANTIYSTPNIYSGIACKEFNIFGVDYSEREFEEGSTIKYLYDNGVELEPLTILKTTNGTCEKRTDSLYISKTGANTGAKFYSPRIDLSPYKLSRAILGDAAYSSNSGIFSWIAVMNNADNSNEVASGQIKTKYENILDITSFNETKYLYIGAYTVGNITVYAEFTEWWLE